MAFIFIFGILFGIAGGGIMLDVLSPDSVFSMRMSFVMGACIGVWFSYVLYRVLE